MAKKQVGLTTENLHAFRIKAKEDKINNNLKIAQVSQGEIDGKPVSWNYSEGKQE